ncbi:hypothetical protein [Robertkochia flava]|uniref:hypothetical protein n=1 Tax=Robertkochia flava TaxID=3447986 RepID=UPI001CCD199E|nr:hypothetical protein [Robertkochia marina]
MKLLERLVGRGRQGNGEAARVIRRPVQMAVANCYRFIIGFIGPSIYDLIRFEKPLPSMPVALTPSPY